jgi:hypothetical protein
MLSYEHSHTIKGDHNKHHSFIAHFAGGHDRRYADRIAQYCGADFIQYLALPRSALQNKALDLMSLACTRLQHRKRSSTAQCRDYMFNTHGRLP